MDIRNILGKLDQLSEGTMAQAKAKPTGPKFGKGKWKGTDPASAAKDKYVGGESILRDLEAKLNEDPVKRDLAKEYREFKITVETALKDKADLDAKRKALQDLEREPGHDKEAVRQRKLDLDKEARAKGMDESFTDLELAVMEGGHELVTEAPVAPPAPGTAPAPAADKPTLGTDLTKPAGQQDAQQQQDLKTQQAAAQKEKQEQTSLMKGVNDLKAAGAAVSNTNQIVNALDKAEDNKPLTPGDKSGIASAGTVLAPIMANPQLQGKFKDLVTQASAAQKKEQQQQANQPAPATTTTPGQTK